MATRTGVVLKHDVGAGVDSNAIILVLDDYGMDCEVCLLCEDTVD